MGYAEQADGYGLEETGPSYVVSDLNLFRKKVKRLINKYSLEKVSNTPDYILAKYLEPCLMAFDQALWKREKFNDEV